MLLVVIEEIVAHHMSEIDRISLVHRVKNSDVLEDSSFYLSEDIIDLNLVGAANVKGKIVHLFSDLFLKISKFRV